MCRFHYVNHGLQPLSTGKYSLNCDYSPRDYSRNKPFHRLEGGMAKNHYSALQVDVVALVINRNYSHRMEGDGRP